MQSFVIKTRDENILQLTYKELLERLNNKYELVGPSETKIDEKVKDAEVLIGRKDEYIFGLDLFYEEGAFVLCVPIPIISNEYKLAIEFVSDLAKLLNTNIVEEIYDEDSYDDEVQEIVYTPEQMLEYDYKNELIQSIGSIKNLLNPNTDNESITLSDTYIVITYLEIVEVLRSPNILEAFDNLIYSKTAYEHLRLHEGFYKQENIINYIVKGSVGKDFVIKKYPFIQSKNYDLVQEYHGYYLPAYISLKMGEVLDYFLTIYSLPKNKVIEIGNEDIYVKALTEKEFKAIDKKDDERLEYIKKKTEEYTKEGKELVYDMAYYHMDVIIDKELDISLMCSLKHIANFMRFIIEKGMTSDFFNKYYGVAAMGTMDNYSVFQKFVGSSLSGSIKRIFLNEEGQRFADFVYLDPENDMYYPTMVDDSARDYFGKEYTSDRFKDEAYLFLPNNSRFYNYVKDNYLEDAYASFKEIN